MFGPVVLVNLFIYLDVYGIFRFIPSEGLEMNFNIRMQKINVTENVNHANAFVRPSIKMSLLHVYRSNLKLEQKLIIKAEKRRRNSIAAPFTKKHGKYQDRC